MAKSSGVAGGFYVGGYDLSGDVGSIDNVGGPRGTLDVTGIGQSGMDRLMLPGNGTMSFKSFFNDAALAEHAILKTLPTTDTHVLYAKGQAVGDACAMLVAKQLNYDATRNQDGSLEFAVETQSTSGVPVEWGVMLTAGAITHTGATNGTTLDQGAQTTAGASMTLHISSFTGSDITPTVQDSSNGSSWAELKVFATATGVGSQRVTVAGTVERYVRVISAGPFNPVTFAVGFRRGEAVDDVAYA